MNPINRFDLTQIAFKYNNKTSMINVSAYIFTPLKTGTKLNCLIWKKKWFSFSFTFYIYSLKLFYFKFENI